MAAITAVPWPIWSAACSSPTRMLPSSSTAAPPAMDPICGCRAATPLSMVATVMPRPVAAAKPDETSDTMRHLGSAALQGHDHGGHRCKCRLMGDDDDRCVGERLPESPADALLGLGVERRGRLVEDQNTRTS